MKKSLYLIPAFLLFVFLNSSAQVTVVEDSVFASSINTTTKFYVILPEGYSQGTDSFPSVYLLHGYSGNYTNWVKLTGLLTYLENYHFIVVTPDAQNSWYSNSIVTQNMNYEDLIVKDLIPFIDHKYRTIRDRKDRAIAGLSMGGYGAAKFGLKYPDLFFFAGCLSPAIQYPAGLEDSVLIARRSKASIQSAQAMFGKTRIPYWDSNDIFILAHRIDSTKAPFFYIGFGSQDGIPGLITQSHQLADIFRQRGIPFEFHEAKGRHEWKVWDREIKIVLQRINEIISGKQEP